MCVGGAITRTIGGSGRRVALATERGATEIAESSEFPSSEVKVDGGAVWELATGPSGGNSSICSDSA
eukprot:685786-Prymnesium_polylepis.1